MDQVDYFLVGALGLANAELRQKGFVLTVPMSSFVRHFHEDLQGFGVLHSFYFGRVVEEKRLAAVLTQPKACKLRRLCP